MADPILYAVEVDLPRSSLAEFSEWYAAVHAPHLFLAGFTTCASYLSVAGGMSVVDIYQAADWAIFESPAFQRYREAAARDPYRPGVLAGVREARTVYIHQPWSGASARGPEQPLDADWISLWRFKGTSVATEAPSWLAREGAAGLAAHGARGMRLLSRGRDTPTGRSHRPDQALLVEWNHRPAPEAMSLLPEWLVRDAGPDELFTGYRLYPWAEGSAPRAELVRTLAALTAS
jgi:hypothetical protein